MGDVVNEGKRTLALGKTVILALALTLLVGLAAPTAARAQEGITVSEMVVSILPEYDQPRILVSYQGTLEGAEAPMNLALQLPADAEVVHACTLKPPENDHICQPYTTELQGDHLLLSYEITYPVFYVEYYYGGFYSAGQRNVEFSFLPPYPVEKLEVWVHEPPQSSDFTISPEPDEERAGGGLRQFGYIFSDVSPEEGVSLQMNYVAEGVPPLAASAGGTDSSSSGGVPRLVLILSLVGVGVLGVSAYVIISRRSGAALSWATARPPGGQGGEAVSFCPRCGSHLRAGSRFCSRCGEAARGRPGEGSDAGARAAEGSNGDGK